ncbi:MAG: hypothetical protein Q7U73_09040 [Rubrivivax sp.]|nr:hypothetical protein [Rubrivivax sp.]
MAPRRPPGLPVAGVGPDAARAAQGSFGGATGVQRHQAFQQCLHGRGAGFGAGVVGQCRLQVMPAVGRQHSGVEFDVQALQHRHQALGVDQLVLRTQRLGAAQFVQHVVHAGEREFGVRGLLRLAVGVELFGQRADADAGGEVGAEAGVVVGEGECLETRAIAISGPVLQRAARGERPLDLDGC